MSANKQLLDKSSTPYGKAELDLFSVPPTQVGVENSFFTEVQAQTTIASEGPFEFRLTNSQFLTDLSKNYIFLRVKITAADGGDIPATDANHRDPYAGPINLLGQTLFQQARLYLNGKLVYDSTDTYAYSSYLSTVLNYSKEVKDNQLWAAGYTKDTPSRIDGAQLAENAGWKKRSAPYGSSRIVELMAPVNFPLAEQDRYLPPHMTVVLSLDRHKDNFVLLSGEQNPDYKLKVLDIRWLVRQVEVSQALELSLRNTMNKSMAKYPVRRLQVRSMYMTPGSRHSPPNSLWNGQIPRRVVVGMVAENAFNGHYQLSPFNFQHFDLCKAWVVANGETYPKRGRPLQCNFSNEHRNEYMQFFVQFFEALGLGGKDKSIDLGFEDLRLGHCLMIFDLKADSGSDDTGWEAIQTGDTRVHIELQQDVQAATGGVRIICMGEFDNLMTIDSNLNVYSDFAI